jgi:hypothetical protein
MSKPTSDEPPTTPSFNVTDEQRAWFRYIGARGGRIGGKRRLETMSAEERKQRARDAVNARWNRVREAKRESEREKSADS